jgi:hypothetical protein
MNLRILINFDFKYLNFIKSFINLIFMITTNFKSIIKICVFI